MPVLEPVAEEALRADYIELLKKTVAHALWAEHPSGDAGFLERLRLIAPSIFGRSSSVPTNSLEGRGWPEYAHTMIGLARLDNLQSCVENVLRDGVPGDFIETGVWRGGACIFMRGILRGYGDTTRKVWLADSFKGLPPPDVERAPADKGDKHHRYEALAISREEVEASFKAYGLLDDQVGFLEGWFKDTLPSAPIERLAVCRLDGDMYESTMDAFDNLYSKLSVGGYLIVDDYGAVPACKLATDEFRAKHRISEPLIPIDWTGVYWRKEA